MLVPGMYSSAETEGLSVPVDNSQEWGIGERNQMCHFWSSKCRGPSRRGSGWHGRQLTLPSASSGGRRKARVSLGSHMGNKGKNRLTSCAEGHTPRQPDSLEPCYLTSPPTHPFKISGMAELILASSGSKKIHYLFFT